MSFRRFTDKADLDPTAVRSLPDNHPAMSGNRTLFPSTVVDVSEDFTDRLLVSGRNNRKLGERVEKGKFKGYALYGLTLEERATCPSDCSVRGSCYGNGMQMARRHKIDDGGLFYAFLEDEIRTLLADEQFGLLVRLHVLGDFPSVEYVGFWSDMLAEHPKLACYGYTHRRPKNWGGDEIGDAIDNVKQLYPDRFRIRWSSAAPRPDGAVVIKVVPNRPRVDEGLVCPAQTDATACCATCGLCWEPATRHDTIAFIKHGPKSGEAAAHEAMKNAVPTQIALAAQHRERSAKLAAAAKPQPAAPTTPAPPKAPAPQSLPRQAPAQPQPEPIITRPIAAVPMPSSIKPRHVDKMPPEIRMVYPRELQVEPQYQRDLSGKSMRLIQKIVSGWDWAKFKPPVCADTEWGLFVIDGQHTAIAAASHPSIDKIPILVVPAAQLERRADAFVAHNRDRLTMSQFQIFHAEVAAGNKEARGMLAAVTRAGGSIPRSQPVRGYAKVGQIIPVNQLRDVYRKDGEAVVESVVKIAVLARLTPVSQTPLRAIRMILREPRFAKCNAAGPAAIASAIASIKDIDTAARIYATTSEQGRDRACAVLIEQAVLGKTGVAA